IAVLDRDGNVGWAKSFGSTALDEGWGIAAGSDGSLYVTGEIQGTVDFGGGPLVPQGYNPFVASFTSDGAYRWAVRFGGDSGTGLVESGFRIAVAGNSDVLVTGRVEGVVDFGDGMLTSPGSSSSDAFYVRLRGSSGALVHKARSAASGGSAGFGVAVDATGNAYLGGTFAGSFSVGAMTYTSRGADDVVIERVDANDNPLWVRTFGGTGTDWLFGIGVVGQTVVTVGYYDGMVNLSIPTSKGLKDSFIATYALDGTPGWARGFGGTGCDLMDSAFAGGGEIVVGGVFSGTVDLGDGPHTSSSASDVLVATFSTAGTVTSSATFGGAGDDGAYVTIGDRATGLYTVSELGMDLGTDCTAYPAGGQGRIRHLAPL
ncbi:MAG TPA: hypothetical protein VLB44_26535, partial [Kofleriaceae bacterium]|nr:hypothetical protein [Kofleriaceae bacterium]